MECPCDKCKKKPNCPDRCYPKMDYLRHLRKVPRQTQKQKWTVLNDSFQNPPKEGDQSSQKYKHPLQKAQSQRKRHSQKAQSVHSGRTQISITARCSDN